jgi:GNAT superfamily N-acetyltransferase
MATFPARAATEADAVALARFLRRCSAEYMDEERGTPEEVEERLHEPGADMALDTALVESDDGEIAGFAHLFTEPPHEDVRCWARVDPADRGRGVGSALVRWALERGAALAERRPDGTPASFPGDLAARECTADDEERLLEAHWRG